ncbi:MAG TPA: hypothetical protein VFH61_08610 [Thermoleophilia bacterium]|nr:hypothetical protein [Thermoleophilia bacterium]
MAEDDKTPKTSSEEAPPAPKDDKADEKPTFKDYDAWLAAQDEGTKALVSDLYEKKTAGLKSALDKERDKASDAAKQLRDLAKTADAETADKLNKLATEKDAEIESARRETAFYRDAAAAGIPGDRLARAWLICSNGDFFTKRGEPDMAALKAELPELFAAPASPSRPTAGRGTTTPPAPPPEDPIRAAVRRQRGQK